jgi:hypothetical protein
VTSVGSPQAVAAPTQVELPDTAVGRVGRDSFYVFNPHPRHEVAVVGARVVGDPSFILERSPSRLRPSHEGVDPAASFAVAFKPSGKGPRQAAVEFDVRAPGGAVTHVRVRLVASGYVDGEPDTEARDAQERENAADTATGAAEARKVQEMDHAVASGKQDMGGLITKDLSRAEALTQRVVRDRLQGLSLAQAAATAYQRNTTALVSNVHGWGGNMLATAGRRLLQGAAQAAIGAASAQAGPAAPLVAAGLSSGLAWAGKMLEDDQSAPREETVAAGSNNRVGVLRYFADSMYSLSEDSVRFVADASLAPMAYLRTLLGSDPAAARAGASALVAGLEKAASLAMPVYAAEASAGWVRLLARESLGEVDPAAISSRKLAMHADGLSDAGRAANSTPGPGGKVYDGLLDVEFQTTLHRPSLAAIKVSGLSVVGIGAASIDRMRAVPLRDLKIPVRARAAGAGVESFGAVAVRDEGGNVHAEDKTGIHWFGRLAGADTPTKTEERNGAKLLMDRIASQTIAELESEAGRPVDTDEAGAP